MPRHYVLVDSNVAAAYFAPKTTTSANLKKRSTNLFNGASPQFEVKFLIPNFCIGEVFAVFEKYRWGRTWNAHVKVGSTLTPKAFAKARQDFAGAIHNGARLLQVELNRYHILCIDLVSPINNAYRIRRNRGVKRNVVPAATFDMQILAMGIWLQNLLGPAEFTIVTGDDRLARVAKRARSVSLASPLKNHLVQVARNLGLTYSPALYPEVINFTQAARSTLTARFPGWQPIW